MFTRLLIGLCFVGSLYAQPPEGIPRELARQRSQQIENVRYRILYAVTPKTPAILGKERLQFVLKPGEQGIPSEFLDFREGTVTSLYINDQTAPTNIQNGHVELPATLLHAGENVVNIDFAAPVAPAGKALTRFEDKDDGSEYIYTLFVPMDASMAFPCFDQPDLKARFRLAVVAPPDWTVISNTAGTETLKLAADRAPDGVAMHRIEFAETPPISTYLFAFAAGPFRKVHDVAGLPGLYVRQSKAKRAEEEAPEVQQVTADGIKYLSNFFAQPFPFPKYDLVLIPGFAYGGMEHAGATFLREESVLFRTVPTESDHLNRDILLLHETTHQWFGDLVTMRWFDDLWLKEGFAQYMAYDALAHLKPKANVWKRFYQAIKPAAYAIDSTQGTTPIYQDIPNLKDAKSAYGAIVYSKAPAVLKQLAFVLGEDSFRNGLRLYLKEHAYSNAEWSDLVGAFERVSKLTLHEWADAYIRRRGMPQVDVEWTCDPSAFRGSMANRINPPGGVPQISLKQHDVLNEGGSWPIDTKILLRYAGGEEEVLGWRHETLVSTLPGSKCPDWIFANDQDYAYGRFLLDPRSRKAVMEQLGGIDDVFERTLLWGSLWDSVREAELDPRDYVKLALRLLPDEKDEALARSILGRTGTALHFYISSQDRVALAGKAEALAVQQMQNSPEKDMRIIWFHALQGFAETPRGRGYLKDLLNGKLTVPGVEVRPLDRWDLVTELVALDDPEASALLTAEEKRDTSGDGRKYAYVAAAARPDPEVKKHYFDEYLHNQSRPEDWVAESLGAFSYWNQTDLTTAYVRPALDALPQVKQERKIFFLLGWLNAFIGGQQSAAAQSQVHEFLRTANLDKDVRLKILQVSDELDRTLRIREKYKTPQAGSGPGGP